MSRRKFARRSISGMREYTCERCAKVYILVRTEAGKWQRLCPVPSYDTGNVVLIDRFPGCSKTERIARTLTPEELASGGIRIRYTDHRATCAHPYPEAGRTAAA